jgi:hypothetical protein
MILFSAGGKTGREQIRKGRKRLEDWFDLFFKYGYVDWNSATYIPVDYIDFFILYEMAPDEDIKNKAREVLDYTFKIMMYNSFNGIIGANTGKEVISPGLCHGLIVRCGGKYEWGGFAAFAKVLKEAPVSYDGKLFLSFQDPCYGLLNINAPQNTVLNEKEQEYQSNDEMEILRGRLPSRRNASGKA